MWNASIVEKQGNLKEMCFLFQTARESERSAEDGNVTALTNLSLDEHREQKYLLNVTGKELTVIWNI